MKPDAYLPENVGSNFLKKYIPKFWSLKDLKENKADKFVFFKLKFEFFISSMITKEELNLMRWTTS